MKQLSCLLALTLVLGLVTTGCKPPPPPPKPQPTKTHTPTPDKDVIAFTDAGKLMAVSWAGKDLRAYYSHPKNSVWFPSAANAKAQNVQGPYGKAGPHFIAWLSKPNGTQNIVRIYTDGSVSLITSIDEKAKPAMKNMRLGSAPVYSHDGKRIAYSHNGNIWIMDADGYNAVTLISDGNSWAPCWSHDDKRIAYVNVFHNKADIWVTKITDKDTYQVTDFEEYTVGHPRFNPNDKKIILTRSQKDSSDVVSVLSEPDQPLVDSEPLTKDHQSASAVFGPDGLEIAFSSARSSKAKKQRKSKRGKKKEKEQESVKPVENKDPFVWYIWRAKKNGKSPQRLASAIGGSPTWLRPIVNVNPVGLVNVRPTPAPIPTAMQVASKPPQPQKPQARVVQTTKNTGVAKKPLSPEKPTLPLKSKVKPKTRKPVDKPKVTKPKAATPKPTPKTRKPAKKPKPKPMPTQSKIAAAALKLRLSVSFDDSDELTMHSLPSVKKIAGRVEQYPTEKIRIYGPLDTSPLKGRYPSNEARSIARAKKVAKEISKQTGLNAAQIVTVPYAPQTLSSSGTVNGIQVHVQLK